MTTQPLLERVTVGLLFRVYPSLIISTVQKTRIVALGSMSLFITNKSLLSLHSVRKTFLQIPFQIYNPVNIRLHRVQVLRILSQSFSWPKCIMKYKMYFWDVSTLFSPDCDPKFSGPKLWTKRPMVNHQELFDNCERHGQRCVNFYPNYDRVF